MSKPSCYFRVPTRTFLERYQWRIHLNEFDIDSCSRLFCGSPNRFFESRPVCNVFSLYGWVKMCFGILVMMLHWMVEETGHTCRSQTWHLSQVFQDAYSAGLWSHHRGLVERPVWLPSCSGWWFGNSPLLQVSRFCCCMLNPWWWLWTHGWWIRAIC